MIDYICLGRIEGLTLHSYGELDETFLNISGEK